MRTPVTYVLALLALFSLLIFTVGLLAAELPHSTTESLHMLRHKGIQVVSDISFRSRPIFRMCSVIGPMLLGNVAGGVRVVAEVAGSCITARGHEPEAQVWVHVQEVLADADSSDSSESGSSSDGAGQPRRHGGYRMLAASDSSDYPGVFRADLTELEAGGIYKFRLTVNREVKVVASSGWQTYHHALGTASPAAATPLPVRLAWISDSQSGAATFRHLLSHIAQLPVPVHGLLHGGDTVQSSEDRREAHEYFFAPLAQLMSAATTDAHVVPTFLARGNHDSPQRLAILTGGSSNYVLRYGSTLRIIVMDSDAVDDEQVAWLSAELGADRCSAAGNARSAVFTIAVMHIPPYAEWWEPTAWRDGGESHWGDPVRDRILPLLRACGVDMVVSGHSHIYQRGQQAPGQPLLVISGGGGGSLELPELGSLQVENTGFFTKTAAKYHYGLFTAGPLDKVAAVEADALNQAEVMWTGSEQLAASSGSKPSAYDLSCTAQGDVAVVGAGAKGRAAATDGRSAPHVLLWKVLSIDGELLDSVAVARCP